MFLSLIFTSGLETIFFVRKSVSDTFCALLSPILRKTNKLEKYKKQERKRKLMQVSQITLMILLFF